MNTVNGSAGLILATVILTFAGCTNPKYQTWPYLHRDTETLGESPEEHRHRVNRVANQDAKGLAEDWDMFMMTDRPSRLNRWQDR